MRTSPISGAAGLKVLELSVGLSASYAGLLLRAQGAEVEVATSLGYRALDAYERAYFERGKQLLHGDWQDALQSADIVICDLPARECVESGLPLSVDELQPGQVAVYMTAFGLTGPNAGFTSSDITEWASGGLAYVTRRDVPEADEAGYSPVLPPGRQPEMLAGIAGATAALFGRLHAEATGEAVVADVSRQEVQAAMLHGVVPPFVWNSIVLGSPASRVAIGMLVSAADGLFYLRPVEAHHWTALYSWMGNPDWTAEPWASDGVSRQAQMPLIRELVAAWASQYPRARLLADGQAKGVPVAVPRSISDVLASEHLAEREFWQRVAVSDAWGMAPSIPLLDPGNWGPSTSSTRGAGVPAGATT